MHARTHARARRWGSLTHACTARRYPVLDGLMVADPETLVPVRPDGETLGEVR